MFAEFIEETQLEVDVFFLHSRDQHPIELSLSQLYTKKTHATFNHITPSTPCMSMYTQPVFLCTHSLYHNYRCLSLSLRQLTKETKITQLHFT